MREEGNQTNPEHPGPAWEPFLSGFQCVSFRAQGVNEVFISPSGLGQDTTTEKNSCLNPRLFNSQRLFHKNNSSRKGRFV